MTPNKIQSILIFIIFLFASTQATGSRDSSKQSTTIGNLNNVFRNVMNIFSPQTEIPLPKILEKPKEVWNKVFKDVEKLDDVNDLFNKNNIKRNLVGDHVNHHVEGIVRKVKEGKVTKNGITTTKRVLYENGEVVESIEIVTDKDGKILSQQKKKYQRLDANKNLNNRDNEKNQLDINQILANDAKVIAEMREKYGLNKNGENKNQLIPESNPVKNRYPQYGDNQKKVQVNEVKADVRVHENKYAVLKQAGLVHRDNVNKRENEKKESPLNGKSNQEKEIDPAKNVLPDPKQKNVVQFLNKEIVKNPLQKSPTIRTNQPEYNRPKESPVNPKNDGYKPLLGGNKQAISNPKPADNQKNPDVIRKNLIFDEKKPVVLKADFVLLEPPVDKKERKPILDDKKVEVSDNRPKQPTQNIQIQDKSEFKIPEKKPLVSVVPEKKPLVNAVPEKKPLVNVVPEKKPLVNIVPEKKPLVSPISTKATENVVKIDSSNNDPQYVPIKIKWELGALKKYCVDNNKMNEYRFLKKLIASATAILRMYVWIPVSQPTFVEVEKGNVCPEYNVPSNVKYDAHLVMLSRIYDGIGESDNQVIAKSICCRVDNAGRSTVGRIAFNSIQMIKESDGITKRNDYLATIVHETLHTLAFYSTSDEMLVKKPIDKALKHLQVIADVNRFIYEDGHWSQTFMPLDIMTPVSTAGAVFTIYDLELLEQRSKNYLGKREKLPYNLFFDGITSESAFFKYKCLDSDEKSLYKFFCSLKQAESGYTGCSMDYTFITQCGLTSLNNNCFPSIPSPTHNCLDTVLQDPKDKGKYEHRGSDARCFETKGTGRSVCLKYRIEASKLKVVLGTNVYECTKDNELIEGKYNLDESTFYNVKFYCPKLQEFISYAAKTTCPENCNDNGFCADGKCLCYDGFEEKNHCRSSSKTQADDLLFTETTGIILQVKEQGK